MILMSLACARGCVYISPWARVHNAWIGYEYSLPNMNPPRAPPPNNGAYAITSFLSGVPDFFDRNKILSGYDLSHYREF